MKKMPAKVHFIQTEVRDLNVRAIKKLVKILARSKAEEMNGIFFLLFLHRYASVLLVLECLIAST